MTDKEYDFCIDNFASSLLRFVRKHLNNHQWAEDIVQETFAKVWEKRKDISFQKAKSYLFTTSYHLMLNHIKKEERKENLVSDNIEANSNEFNNISDVLDMAFEKLSEKEKTSVLLRDYEGYSYEEIAQIQDISLENVKINIFRARVKLKKYLVSIDNIV